MKKATIEDRLRVVRRLASFSNLYPWQWTPAEVEAFFDDLRSGPRPVAVSTARSYQLALRLFLDYATDTRYGWPRECLDRVRSPQQQVLHAWNTITHLNEFEGQPGRRPLSYDEVQALFDAADSLAVAARRRGALQAMRNATVLKTIYAFGLRRREVQMLDLTDLRRNSKVPDYGNVGGVFVRWGKSSRGGAPKRRTVLTVPEMDWIVAVIGTLIDEVRPQFGCDGLAAMWVNERAGRMSVQSVYEAFVAARDEAGLDDSLGPHGLRHSYVTHLLEFGYPERFVQDQVGHAYAATTALNAGVSDEYRNRLLVGSLRQHEADLWEA